MNTQLKSESHVLANWELVSRLGSLALSSGRFLPSCAHFNHQCEYVFTITDCHPVHPWAPAFKQTQIQIHMKNTNTHEKYKSHEKYKCKHEYCKQSPVDGNLLSIKLKYKYTWNIERYKYKYDKLSPGTCLLPSRLHWQGSDKNLWRRSVLTTWGLRIHFSKVA